ncbi:MAG: hypothetical protein L6Q75_05055 [Burkholderiaceae bacterium]|nr:hypothetical protein [Burkholderiaceae bacterium]
MIRQTLSDRLRWWATLLEGRSIADRQHGWSGLWLSSEDAGVLVRLLREAAAQGSLPLEIGRSEPAPHGRAGRPGDDDDWPDTQPFGLDDGEAPQRPRPAAPPASRRLSWS